jgi:sulfur-oxidizing protein SoxA
MIVRVAALAAALSAAACALPAGAQERTPPLDKLQSGAAFLSPELRAQQLDDFANPGMLWVERGAKLWAAPAGASGRSCADCHGDARASMKGVAAGHPLVDRGSGRLVNVTDRILECRTERQGAPRPASESNEVLALGAFVAHQSRGVPVAVTIDGPARTHFESGRALYTRRVGQMNLACTQCHDANWGKTLFSERISQGHPNAYPAYRLEWQTLGSLERRIRACLSGVRAEMLPYGAPEYRDLELFLMWRAAGLAIETPGLRR